MNMQDVLNGIDYEILKNNDDYDVAGISYDSRKVSSNHAFVCITGFKTDGHKYINQAIANGAKHIIVERDIEINDAISIYKVKNSRQALSKMASNFFEHPSKDIYTFGITGTNGKTSTTYMIHEILKQQSKPCGLIGTIAYQIGSQIYESVNTTPESFELQKLFYEMKKQHIAFCSMEVSSHSLALDRVADIDFDIGVFTNLTQDHLDFHHTFEAYYEAKKSLFFKTKKMNIVNVDDEYGLRLVKELKSIKTPLMTYGIENNANLQCINLKMMQTHTSFDVVYNGELKGNIVLKVLGRFSVYNALASIGAAMAAGITFKAIQQGFNSLEGISGRFEIVPNEMGMTIIVDYAHTPDALEKLLASVKEIPHRKLICVFGAPGERDQTKRPIMGEIVGNNVDYSYITCDNPKTESLEVIMNHIEEGMKKTNCPYEKIEDRHEAIKKAIEAYEPEDIIILAGKGHETYQDIGTEKIPFNDKETALEIIHQIKRDR